MRWIEKGEGEEYEVEPAMMGMGERWSGLRIICEEEGREVALGEEGKADGEPEMVMESLERAHEWMLYLASVERELSEEEEKRVEERKIGQSRRRVERAKVVGRELREGKMKLRKEIEESAFERGPALLPLPWLQDLHGYYYLDGVASTCAGKSWWHEVDTAMEVDLDMLLEEDMNV